MVPGNKKETHPYSTCKKCSRIHMGKYMASRDGNFESGEIRQKRRDYLVITPDKISKIPQDERCSYNVSF